MKKSDMNAVEPAKTELEAPVQLTPEQLETVAGGFAARHPPDAGRYHQG